MSSPSSGLKSKPCKKLDGSRQHVPTKHPLTFKGLHGVISQKIKLLISKWTVVKWDWGGLDTFGSGQRPVVSSCEQGNEPLGSINAGNFLSG
jgi:hypothetical protein